MSLRPIRAPCRGWALVDETHKFANHIIDATFVTEHVTPAFDLSLTLRFKTSQRLLKFLIDH